MTASVRDAALQLSAAAQGLRKVRAKNALARKYQSQLREFFQDQKTAFLEQFRELKPLFPDPVVKTNRTTSPLGPQSPFFKQFDSIWDGVEADTRDYIQKIIDDAETEALEKGVSQLAKTTGQDENKFWDLKNPRAVAWFKEKAGSIEYIKGIQDTTKTGLKTIITQALDEGWSYNVTAKAISGKFDEFSRDRAKRIAVFETGQAYEAGNRLFAEGLQEDGVEMEEHWMTSHDSKVRPEHAANEAEGWVPIGHVFSSGDTEPPTDPGCRCYMIYRQKSAGATA